MQFVTPRRNVRRKVRPPDSGIQGTSLRGRAQPVHMSIDFRSNIWNVRTEGDCLCESLACSLAMLTAIPAGKVYGRHCVTTSLRRDLTCLSIATLSSQATFGETRFTDGSACAYAAVILISQQAIDDPETQWVARETACLICRRYIDPSLKIIPRSE